LIRLARGTARIRDNGILDVNVHHVFGLEEEAANQFALFRFDFHDGAFGIVQDDNGNADAVVSDNRHAVVVACLVLLCLGRCCCKKETIRSATPSIGGFVNKQTLAFSS
jgi:hypothetical protein